MNMRWLRLLAPVLSVLLLGGDGNPSKAQERPAESDDVTQMGSGLPAGRVLGSAFGLLPPKAKGIKGALQRERTELFSSLLGQVKRDLQLAFVIDGTESMGRDIASVKEGVKGMVEDIQNAMMDDDAHLSFAVVVYRDTGAKEGPVALPLQEFTDKFDELRSALETIEVDTGFPWFHELVDEGIHAALQDLNWSVDEDTGRWIIVLGDAPPFAPDYTGPGKPEPRKYSDNALLVLAREKGVRINAILCSSGFMGELANDTAELQKTYVESLPETRQFFKTMAKGNVFWDLSDPGFREEMVSTLEEKEKVIVQKIAKITPADLEKARYAKPNAANGDSAAGGRVRLAILPHMPLEEMNLLSDDQALLVATEMRTKLRLIPNIEVVSQAETEEAVKEWAEETRKEELREASDEDRSGLEQALLHDLTREVNADFIVWGSYEEADGRVALKTAIYKKVGGEKLAEAGDSTSKGSALGETSLVASVAQKLLENASKRLDQLGINKPVAATFARLEKDRKIRRPFSSPISRDPRAWREFLKGFEFLERALAHERKAEGAREPLSQAATALESGLKLDENAFAYLMLASCYYNQIEMDVADDDKARQRKSYFDALEKAYELKDQKGTSEPVKTEIEADYALLREKDFGKAIDLYESLLGTAEDKHDQHVHFALRAHWMLAGIRCGDWGVDEAFVDPDKAREHIIQILANWSTSPEAEFYEDTLRWDEETGSQDRLVFNQNEATLDIRTARGIR